MPSWIKEIVDGLGPCFDQITINKYSPGDGIASHVDTHSSFMNTFHIISLGSEIVMEFRNGLKQVDALLRAGSLLTVADEARYGLM